MPSKNAQDSRKGAVRRLQWAGHPGTLVKNTTAANGDKIEVWAKPLNNITGKMAVLIMNIANLNLDEAGWATNVASTSAAVVAVSGDAKPVNSTVTVKPDNISQ